MDKLPPKVLVMCKDEELAQFLLRLFAEEQVQSQFVQSAEQLFKCLSEFCPDVTLMDYEPGFFENPSLIEQLKGFWSENKFVCMLSLGHSEMECKLQAYGISDYVVKPLDDIEVIQTIQRVMNKRLPAFLLPDAEIKQQSHQAQIITFFSTVSGAGKTVLALNLAAALNKLNAGKICIIDADLQFGDIAGYLRYQAEHTVDEYAALFTKGASVYDFVSSWNESIDLLVAPKTIKEAELVTPLILSAAVRELSCYYQYVVIDTTTGFNEWTLNMLDLASTVFFVSTAEHVPSVRKVRIGLDILHSLGYGQERIRLLLNRYNAKQGLDLYQIETALNTKFQLKIANNYEVVAQSIHNGMPFIDTQPECDVSRQLNELAAQLMNSDNTDKQLNAFASGSWLIKKITNWF